MLPESLIPVPAAGPAARNGIDLRRADEAARRRRRMMPTLLCVFEQIPLA